MLLRSCKRGIMSGGNRAQRVCRDAPCFVGVTAAGLPLAGYVLNGILNGIDSTVWNPSCDNLLERKYGAADVVEGKRAAKGVLQRELGLPERDVSILTRCCMLHTRSCSKLSPRQGSRGRRPAVVVCCTFSQRLQSLGVPSAEGVGTAVCI